MKLITAQEVAKIMNCAESTIRTNAKKGTLGFGAVKVGSLWKFRDEEVYEYVYGKNWKEIVYGIVGDGDKPEVALDKPDTVEELKAGVMENAIVHEPAPEKPAPVNVIPLGAREVTFDEDSGNLETGSGQI